MFGSAAEAKGINLSYENNSLVSLIVDADSNHLERIIYNLIANALKFTDTGGQIIVSLSNGNARGIVSV